MNNAKVKFQNKLKLIGYAPKNEEDILRRMLLISSGQRVAIVIYNQEKVTSLLINYLASVNIDYSFARDRTIENPIIDKIIVDILDFEDYLLYDNQNVNIR